jgi:hypothetical protein
MQQADLFSKPATTSKRDIRIDFFRGLALCMIYVDHVHGDPLSHFTFHAYGLADAAEIFVFLSGLGCGIAYSGVLTRRGWPGVTKVLLNRLFRIYLFYLATGCLVIFLARYWLDLWEHAGFQDSLRMSAEHPWPAILDLITLKKSPSDTGILSFYMLLTSTSVPLFLAFRERGALALLLSSACVWLLSASLDQWAAPLFGAWYLNPFAWQFLFSIGIYLGIRWNGAAAAMTDFLRGSPRLISLLWALVAVVFLYKVSSVGFRYAGFGPEWLQIPQDILDRMKHDLSGWRLMHFLCVALLAAIYVRGDNRLINSWLFKPLVWCGQYSLEIFSLLTVMDTLVNTAVLGLQPSGLGRVALDIAAILLAFGAAAALRYYRSSAQRRIR